MSDIESASSVIEEPTLGIAIRASSDLDGAHATSSLTSLADLVRSERSALGNGGSGEADSVGSGSCSQSDEDEDDEREDEDSSRGAEVSTRRGHGGLWQREAPMP